MAGPSRIKPFLIGCLSLLVLAAVFVVAVGFLFSDKKTFEDPFGEKIGVVEVNGVIGESQDVVDQIKKYRKDSNVKAILVRIDSPGGAVAPSQEIYDEIRKTIAKKPVVASMATLAASGGFYIACAANKVVANPGTITGSIGVIFVVSNFEELMSKIGLKEVVIKSGKFKDIGSPTRPMTDEERDLLQSGIDDVYDQFVQAIVDGRGLKREEVLKIADGRIFSGRQAKDLGLVDQLGGYEDALDLAASLGKVKGEPGILKEENEENWFLKLFFGNFFGRLKNELKAPTGMQYLWIAG